MRHYRISLRKKLTLSAILAGAFAASASSSLAQTTFTWDNGAANLLWGDPINWSGDNGPPTALDTAIIPSNGIGAITTIDLGGVDRSVSILNFTSATSFNYLLGNGGLVDVTAINQTADDPNAIQASSPITTASGGLSVLNSNVTSNTLQLQGRITSGGVIKTGGGILRLGTSGTAFNGAIAGDIVINGGTLQVSAGNTNLENNPMASSGGTGAYTINAGDDVIIGASGVTFSTTHSNLGSATGAGTYDWGRNIIANDNSFSWTADRAAGSANSGTAQMGTITIGNATLRVDGSNGFTFRTDGLLLNPGATTTVQTDDSLRIDSLAGNSASILRKTGSSSLNISPHAAGFAGNMQLAGGTTQIEIDHGGGLNPLMNTAGIQFQSGSTLNLRYEATTAAASTNISFDANTITSTINVDRRTGIATGQRIDLGSINLTQVGANPKTLTVSQGNSFQLGTTDIIVGNGTGTFNNTADVVAGKLTVAAGATLIKTGGNQLTLTGDSSSSIQGAVLLRQGTITGSVAGYLGNQGITVGNSLPNGAGYNNDTSRLRYTIAGASGAAGTDATAIIGGVIDLDATPAITDTFSVAAYGRIQGTTAQLGALTVGSNLTLANDAIIMHENPAAAGNTVAGLPNNASYYYGLANNAATLPTIGVGTPWKGISGDISARDILGANGTTPAVININGGDNNPATVEAYLLAMNNSALNVGTTGSTNPTTFATTAALGEKVTLGIRGVQGTTAAGLGKGGTVSFNDAATSTNIAANVDKILVEGSMLLLNTPQTLGGVPVEVINEGVLDIANANTNLIDGNVLIQNGGTLVLNDSQPTNGTGIITIGTGGKLDVVGNNVTSVLSGGGGTQPINFVSTGNNAVRFSASNITGLDAAVPNDGAVWVVSGGTNISNFASTNIANLSTNSQSAGLSTNGGVITNDGTSRGLDAPLTIGPAGATIAATRNTNFVLNGAINTTGNIQIGSLTPIEGREKGTNVTALNSTGFPDPTNSTSQVYFGNDFAANNVNVINTHVSFYDADTAITGNLSITGGVLYLDGGGNISGTIGELTPRLVAGTVAAGGITLGSNTRTEIKLDLPGSGRLDVTQAFIIDGEGNPQDNRRFWISRNSGTTTGVNFTNVTLNANSALSIDEDNTDVRMSLKLKGDVNIFNSNDNFDLIDVVRDPSAPANVLVTNGRFSQTGTQTLGNPLVSNIFGTIGAGVQVDNVRGQTLLMNGATLDGVIRTQVAAAGGDSFVWSSSNGATVDSTIGGTGRIELGRSLAANGPEDFEIRGTEVASGTSPLHTHATLVRVIDDGSLNIDGIIRSNRHNDAAVAARVAASNIEVNSGGGVQYATTNNIPLTVSSTKLLGNGLIDLANTGITLTTVDAGTNNVTLQGGGGATITNPIIANNVTINGATVTVPVDSMTGNLTVGANPGGTVSSGVTGAPANVTATGTLQGTLNSTGSVVATADVNGAVTLNTTTATFTGNLGSTLNMTNSVANVNAGGGTKTIAGPVSLNLGSINVSNGTLDAGTNLITGGGESVVAGLREIRLPGAFDTTTPNNASIAKLGPIQAQITTNWGSNETYAYTGEFFVPDNNGNGTGTFSFAENFDDSVKLTVNGTDLLNNGTWNVASTSGAQTLPTGWYSFDLRLGQAGGGAGPNANSGWNTQLGFGIDLTLPIEGNTTQANYTAPVDNGSMNLFRTTIGSALNIASNSTIKAGGVSNLSDINFDGSSSTLELVANTAANNSTVTRVNVATGASGTLLLAEALDSMTVGSVSLGGALNVDVAGTVTVTGAATGSGNLTKVGPGTLVLSGTNTYTGQTIINAGMLKLATATTNNIPTSSQIALGGGTLDVTMVTGLGGFALASNQILSGVGTVFGSLTAGATTEVRPGDTGVAGTLNFGPLTLSGAGLTFDLGTTSDLIDLGTNLLTGTGTNTFTLNNLAGFGVGNYTLIDYGTLAGGTSLSNFVLSSPTLAGFNVALSDTGSAIVLNVTAISGTSIWQGADNDLWTAGSSWNGGVPNSATAEARFETSGGTTANLDVLQTVNKLTFDATAPHTIGGTGTLALAGTTPVISTAGSNTATHTVAVNLDLAAGTAINVQGGTLELNSPSNATLGTGVTATVANGATLRLGGAGNALSDGTSTHANVANNGTLSATSAGKRVGHITGTGTTDVTAASATLTASSIRQSVLSIGATSTATVAPSLGNKSAGISVFTNTTGASLSIAAGGNFDTNDNDLIVYYQPGQGAATLATIQQQIIDGFLNTPAVAKISSSTGAVDGDKFLVAIDNGAIGLTDWEGVSLTGSNQIIAKYTLFGDLNLDGSVDSFDYSVIDSNFGTGNSWLSGDANLDGVVNSFDYSTVDTNFGKSFPSMGGGAANLSIAAVPEPSTFVLGGLGLLGLAGLKLRRRGLKTGAR